MRLIYFTIFIFYATQLFSQFKPYQYFTEKNGLVDNSIEDLIFDKEGCIWIGTNNGVSKYDGEHFTNFKIRDGLLGNYNWSLAVDKDSNIWVGCYGKGLNLIKNNKVIGGFSMNLDHFNNSIRKLYYSKNYKLLFVGTDNGLFYFKDSIFTKLPYPHPDDKKNSILAIKECQGKIFFAVHGGRYGGMYEMTKDTSSDMTFSIKKLLQSNKFSIETIGDSLFCNSSQCIFKWNYTIPNSDTTITKLENFLAWDLTKDSENKLLLAGWGDHEFEIGGVKKYDPQNGTIKNIPYDIKGKSFMTIIHDSTNNITWAGGDGLYAFSNNIFSCIKIPDVNNIIDIIDIKGDKYILTNSDVYTLSNNEEKTNWIMSNKYLNDRLMNGFNQYQKQINNYNFIPHAIKNVIDLKILRFIKTHDKIYLMTNKGSLSFPALDFYLPFVSGRFSLNNKTAYSVRDYNLIQYFPDWIKSINTTKLPNNAANIRDIVKIVEKEDTLLFPSRYHGLYALINKKEYELNSTKGLDDIIKDLDVSKDGDIWCCSMDGNLFNIGFKDSLFVKQKYNNENGLIGTKFNWLKFYKHYLYLGTNEGLNIIPINQIKEHNDTLKPLFYNNTNGYNYILSQKPQIDSNGKLYVFNSENLIYIDKPIDTLKSELQIKTIFLINGKKNDLKNNSLLPHYMNNIQINFSCIKYPSASNLIFQYKINNGDWIDGNKIRLELVMPGKYSIEYKIFNTENASVTVKNINFRIDLPLWRKWWFISLLFLICTGCLYYIINKRITKIRKDAEERQNLNLQLNEIRIRSLQGQLNPHFIFNALNSIQYFILSENIMEALNYLGNLSGIIRQNLNNLGEELIPLKEEEKFITQYLELEKLRFKSRINYNIDLNVYSESIMIPPMLIQPFIENAIKHGLMHKKDGGTIFLNIHENENNLIIKIIDDGIGREKAKEISYKKENGNGKAMDITKKRLQLLNQKFKTNNYSLEIIDLYDNEGIPSGTQIVLSLHKI